MSANGQNSTDAPSIIRRSDMGLAISGTRTTIYLVLDYLHDNWPRDEIRKWLNLTEAQLQAALDYIEAHREEVEAEYEEVVRADEEQRLYWEERLREHLASRPPTPVSPEKAALYKKLAEQRGQILRELMQRTEEDADKHMKTPRR
jgi:uncharacterized protein (DUF433 family)